MTKRTLTHIPKKSRLKLAKIPDVSQVANGVLGWLDRRIGHLLIGVGALGAFASFMLVIEEYDYLRHPGAALGCDLNPIINCGANMDLWQGHVFFNVPNQVFGLAAFSAILALGVAILAGARFSRWFWQSLYAGLTLSLLFVIWFMYQSLYVIGHLCPYCMVTWVSTMVGFWYTFLYGIRAGHISLKGRMQRVGGFMQRHHADIIAVAFLIVISLILKRFWYYFAG